MSITLSFPGLCLSPSITIVSQSPFVDMDRASQMLAEDFPVDLPQTWAARSCPQAEVLNTPITPVTTEGLMSLHTLIQQDAHAIPEESRKHRLQRHVQKLANAA
jgi:hypothetical protein